MNDFDPESGDLTGGKKGTIPNIDVASEASTESDRPHGHDDTSCSARQNSFGNTGVPLVRLNFSRSFWIILSGIATLQVFELILAAYYGVDRDFSTDYYVIQNIGGAIWSIAFVMVVVGDLRRNSILLQTVFRLDLSIATLRIGDVLKYFLGCSIFVIVMSFLFPENELHLEHQTSSTILMIFISVVVIAPICEELIFRGYLYTSMLSGFKRKRERMVVNAMLFACAHVFLIQLLVQATIPFYIFILGYLLAKLYEESRSVIPCILLHGLNNGLIFGLEFAKVVSAG